MIKRLLYWLIYVFLKDYNEYIGYEESALTIEQWNKLSYKDKKNMWIKHE